MRIELPVIGPAYKNQELPISAQETKGLFPEVNQEGKSLVSLRSFPGLKSFATASGKHRGSHTFNGVYYCVNGDSLYSVTSDATVTNLGTITGSGFCDFASSADQMIITTGGTAYVYTDNLAEITDPDLVNPTTVGYLNSQFIFDNNDGNSGEFITSAIGDGSDVSALDFAIAESHPDDIKRVVIANELVYFFGGKTIEPWFNSGVGRPPFDRVNGRVRPYGLIGPQAVDTLGEFTYFIDDKRRPHIMSGFSVQPIGDVPLVDEWETYSTVSDAIGFAYTMADQTFFQVSFPTADKSWLFHAQSNSWVQTAYSADEVRHRGASHQYVYGKHLIADHSNGNIYEYDFKTYTDNGQPIVRERVTAAIHGGLYGAPGAEIFYGRVEFDLQTGEGLLTGQGVDPTLMVSRSDDRGRTWSAEEHYSLGVQGDYLKRVTLHNEGSARERIYKLRFTDPVPFTLMSANADVDMSL